MSVILSVVPSPAPIGGTGCSVSRGNTSAATAIAPIEHRPDDIRAYSRQHVIACKRDKKAALMLAQLLYWWPRRINGNRGIKKSLVDWDNELCFTRYEAEHARDKLVKLGLVELYFAPWGRYESDATFYVLTPAALALMIPEKAPVRNSHVLSKSTCKKLASTENTYPLTETTKEKIQTSELIQTSGSAAIPKSNQEKENPKPTPMVLEKDSAPIESPSSTPESPDSGSPDNESPDSGWHHYNELAAVYDMDALLAALKESRYIGADRKMLSEKECRILWPLHLQILKSELEDDLISTLRTFGSPDGAPFENTDWDWFCVCVEEFNPKVSAFPQHPNLLFLKKHFAGFCAYAAKQLNTDAAA